MLRVLFFEADNSALLPLLLLCCVLVSANIIAQTVTIGSQTSNTYLQGPIYRSSFESEIDHSRYSYLFTSAELGIPPGSRITKLEFYKGSISRINNTGNASFLLYMENTLSNSFSSDQLWGNVIANATQVIDRQFNNVVPHPAIPGNLPFVLGWMEFPTDTFIYSGNSLQVSAAWDVSTVTDEPTDGPIKWWQDGDVTDRTLGAAGTSPPPLLNNSGTYASARPVIRISYLPPALVDDDAGLVSITAPVGPIAAGMHNLEMSVQNFGLNNINSLQINWSVNGAVQGPLAWTGTLPITVGAIDGPTNLTSVNFPFGIVELKVWTEMPNGTVDNNALNDTATVQLNVCDVLSGNYSINSGGGGDFLSFNDALDQLASCGVNGPVVLEVDAGSGPYNERLVIPMIPGASGINTITINGNSESLLYSANSSLERAALLLDGAAYIQIQNLVIDVSSGSYGWGINLANGTHDVVIQDCEINTSASSTLQNFAGILASHPTSVNLPGDHADEIAIRNCVINGGYYGIRLGGQNISANGNVLENNLINDPFSVGIYISDQVDAVISSNNISRSTRSSGGSFYGIFLSGANLNCTINANRIHNTHNNQNAQGGDAYGIYFSGCDALPGLENIVQNNAIYSFNSQSGAQYGLYNIGSDHVRYWHNSVVLNDANSSSGISRGFHQETSATGVELKNNLFLLARSGSGTRHALFLGASGSSIISDFNVLHVPIGPGPGYTGQWSGANAQLLSDWQLVNSGQFDQNSISADPLLAAPGSGDITPTSTFVNDIADPLVPVTFDLNHIARPLGSAPDPGAIEFDPPAIDASISWINPSAPLSAGTHSVIVNISNAASSLNDINAVQLSYSNGIDPAVSELFSNLSIAAGTSAQVQFTIPYLLNTFSELRAWVDLVNNAPDAIQSNDTTAVVAICPALGGNYSIDENGSGDFSSFTEMAGALNNCGVSAPVFIEVAPGSGPYSERLLLNEIPGASSLNTIDLNGSGGWLEYSSSDPNKRAAVQLNGTDHFRLKGLVVDVRNGLFGWGIVLTAEADSNSIDSCTVFASANGTNSDHAGIMLSSPNAAFSTGAFGSYNEISNCEINGGAFGIKLNGMPGASYGNALAANVIRDAAGIGIDVSNNTLARIEGNDISRPTRTIGGDFVGIKLGTGVLASTVNANLVHSSHDNMILQNGTATGIFLEQVLAQPGFENIVQNNRTWDLDPESGNVNGIRVSGADQLLVWHNTVLLNGSTSISGHTRGFVVDQTANGLDVRNNIFSIDRAGTGQKHCIYNSLDPTVLFDHNVLRIASSVGTVNAIGYFNESTYAELIDWQTANGGVWGQNSSDMDPAFVAPQNGDLEPSNFLINDIGDLSVQVGFDAAGLARPLGSAPDPGALEFEPPSCATPAGIMITSITDSSAVIEWQQPGTGMSFLLEYGETGFSLGTGIQISGILPGPPPPVLLNGLSPNTDYEIYIQEVCLPGSDSSLLAGPFSFSTSCAIFIAPFVEHFNNQQRPDCWSESGLEPWRFGRVGSEPQHGGYQGQIDDHTASTGAWAWIDDSSPHNIGSTLLSPLVDISALTVPELSFFLNSDNEGNSNVVLHVDIWNGATWNNDALISTSNTQGWEQRSINLLQLSISGPVQLRFRVDEMNGTDFYDDIAIDDVRIDNAADCASPSQFSLLSATPGALEIDWIPGAGNDAFVLEYGPSGFLPGNGSLINGIIPPGPPSMLNNLQANSTYDVYVTEQCPVGSSVLVGPITFSTIAAIDQFPYCQDFESFNLCSTNCGDPCAIPLASGWVQENSDDMDWTVGAGSTITPNSGPAVDNSGSISGKYLYTTASAPCYSSTAVLYSPPFDASGMANDPLLTFAWHMFGANMGSLILDIEQPAGAGNWNELWTRTGQFQSTSNAAWVKDTIVLTDVSGSFRIRITGITGPGNTSNMALDDLCLLEGICNYPQFNLTSICLPDTTFNVLVDILDLGSADSLDITNDLTSSAHFAVDGMQSPYTIGPFSDQAEVEVTVSNSVLPGCAVRSNISTMCTPAPANDLCAHVDPALNMISVGGSISLPGTVNGSTDDAGLIGNFFGPDVLGYVWEAFTLSECADLMIQFCSSTNNFENVSNHMFRACGGQFPLSTQLIDQNTCPDGRTSLFFNSLGPGIYYYPIPWDPGQGSVGAYELSVQAFAPTTACTPDLCTMADTLVCGVPVGGSILSNSISQPASCFAQSNGPDAWYFFSSPSDTLVTVSTCLNANFDTRLSVWQAQTDCNSLICVSGNDDNCGDRAELSFLAQAGIPYYIVVHAPASGGGIFQLIAVCASPCTFASNDECSGALSLTVYPADGSGIPTTGSNECAFADPNPICAPTDHIQGVWYTFNSGTHTAFNLTLLTNSEDPVYTSTEIGYTLYIGSCSGLTEIQCASNGAGTELMDGLLSNATYYLNVWNRGGIGIEGTFGLLLEHRLQYDVGVLDIVKPKGTECDTLFQPMVEVVNYGTASISNFQLEQELDLQSLPPVAWGGQLEFMDTVLVTLPYLTTTDGPHAYSVNTSLPNGLPDEAPLNDVASSFFDVSGVKLLININTDAFGNEVTWEIYNAFQLLTAQGGPYASNAPVVEEVCLSTVFGNCYEFRLYDAFGDGICCANGMGNWSLADSYGNTFLADGGDYEYRSPPLGSVVSGHEFCLPLGQAAPLPTECNVFTNELLNKVYCDAIPGAISYQFEFSDPDGDANGYYRRRLKVFQNWMRFDMIQSNPLLYGVEYWCRVRVDVTGNGFFDDAFGNGCKMGLIAQGPPCTQLLDDTNHPWHSCDVSRSLDVGEAIWATKIANDQQYRFRFEDQSSPFVRQITSPSTVLYLNTWSTNPLSTGNIYSVMVEVMVNNTWGGFCGDTCTLELIVPPVPLASHKVKKVVGQLQLWPNPVTDGHFTLSTEEDLKVTRLSLYDLTGKTLSSRTEFRAAGINTWNVKIPLKVHSGTYIIEIRTSNGSTQIQKIQVTN